MPEKVGVNPIVVNDAVNVDRPAPAPEPQPRYPAPDVNVILYIGKRQGAIRHFRHPLGDADDPFADEGDPFADEQ